VVARGDFGTHNTPVRYEIVIVRISRPQTALISI
jgi:hypothetical protein